MDPSTQFYLIYPFLHLLGRSGNEDECVSSLAGSDCPPLEDIDTKAESDIPPSSGKTDPSGLAEALRSEGNEFFKENEYDKSIEKYKEALAVGKGNVVNEVKCLRYLVSITLSIILYFQQHQPYFEQKEKIRRGR